MYGESLRANFSAEYLRFPQVICRYLICRYMLFFVDTFVIVFVLLFLCFVLLCPCLSPFYHCLSLFVFVLSMFVLVCPCLCWFVPVCVGLSLFFFFFWFSSFFFYQSRYSRWLLATFALTNDPCSLSSILPFNTLSKLYFG